jgi:hypothetical protein
MVAPWCWDQQEMLIKENGSRSVPPDQGNLPDTSRKYIDENMSISF